jgi:ubiquitin-conjugating enzyme E2 H
MAMRKNGDLTKLMMAGYEVELINDSCQEFFVKFAGPQDTLYEGATYKIRVGLPEQYPYHPPSIAFVNRVYHPNIDERSGSVCLDVINQTWTPLYSLVNVFQMFLPQLLTYPNMSDPLNSQAASTWMKDRSQYEEKVKEYVRLYAQGADASTSSKRTRLETEETTDPSSDDNVSELSAVDMEDDLDLDMDL